MTPNQRLHLYESALKDYEESARDWHPEKVLNMNTWYGFCLYFDRVLKINVYGTAFRENFPELYNQKKYASSAFHYPYVGFEDVQGITDRITALKTAIKEVKTKIN